ncbi:MAG: hypothetical protein KIS62_09425 [Ramlibacter sp.]|nr:hypothetical protein [Ramlibacter sp.]
MNDHDQTASLMSPSKLARIKPQQPTSPGAWLDQMAADVGQLQVVNLTASQRALASQLRGGDLAAALAASVEALQKSLQGLDFDLLQTRGWWARATGKARSAGTEFAGQVDEIGAALKVLSIQVSTAHKAQADSVSATERTLLEVEVEHRALDQMVEQGAKWLQDMRAQLQQRHAAAAGSNDPVAQQQVKADAARCEILVTRLKALRALGASAQQALTETREALARRATLMQLLGQALPATARNWNTRLSSLAASVSGGSDGASLNLEGPQDIHQQLQKLVSQALADCAAVQASEKALVGHLDALGQQLSAIPGH